MHRSDSHPRTIDYLVGASCVGFLFAGLFKATPVLSWLPLDLTLVLGIIVMFFTAIELIERRFRLRIDSRILLFSFLFLPAWFYGGGTDNTYWQPKLLSMLLAFLAAISSFILINNERRLKAWIAMFAIVACTLVPLTALDLVSSTSEDARLSLEGSNTIAAGRATGCGLVIFGLLTLYGRGRLRLFSLFATCLFIVGVIATGARGPVFASAAAVALTALLASRHRRFGQIALLAAVGASGWIFLTESDTLGASRITSTLSGETSAFGTREPVWNAAIRMITDIPRGFIGVGWANFASNLLPGEARGDAGDRQYAHNFVLEVASEGGWALGIAVIIFVLASLIRIVRRVTSVSTCVLLGMAIFFVANALVSGDVGDNRAMWAILAVCWTLPISKEKHANARQHVNQYTIPHSRREHSPIPALERTRRKWIEL